MIFKPAPFASRLLDWFDRSRRDLPWRLPRDAAPNAALDPYLVFISEAMLQQTQVSTVIPYFHRFCQAFPTVRALADADEQAVLRLWQGLGYYSRARNLRRAAQQIVSEFAGKLPETVEGLLKLPGVGRYTAGAIASIAFNRRAPILDGNVARVLCRIDRIESDPREPATVKRLWARAEEILPAKGKRIGDFNSALMELGALVCTPRSPQCLLCPVSRFCQAYADGVQDRIPMPRKSKATPLIKRWTFLIQHEGKYLIEQRPATGRWAGLWQFVTIEPTGKRPTPVSIKSETKLAITKLKRLGTVRHALTHRRYHFDVFSARVAESTSDAVSRSRVWVTLTELNRFPLSVPQLKMIEWASQNATHVDADASVTSNRADV